MFDSNLAEASLTKFRDWPEKKPFLLFVFVPRAKLVRNFFDTFALSSCVWRHFL